MMETSSTSVRPATRFCPEIATNRSGPLPARGRWTVGLVGRPAWLGVLLFIMLFRFGDSLASVMANPFYLAMDFTKMEIAAISKVFGVIATLLGGLFGGFLVSGMGMKKALLIAGISFLFLVVRKRFA